MLRHSRMMHTCLNVCLSGLTEYVSSFALCRQEGVTDAIHVLSHYPDNVLAALDQLRHLKQHTAGGCEFTQRLSRSAALNCQVFKYLNILYIISKHVTNIRL